MSEQVALSALAEEKDGFLKEQLQDQADDHLAEIEALKSLLQKEANEAGDELLSLENARAALELQLGAEKKEHAATKLEAAERLAQTMTDAEARRLREISELQKNLTGDAEEKMDALLKKHAREVAELQDTAAQQLQTAIDKYEAEKKQTHLDAQKHLKNSLLDLQTKHGADKKEALAALDSEYTSQIGALNDVHKTALDACHSEIKDLKRSVALNQDNNTDLQNQLEALHQEKSRRAVCVGA